MHVLSVSCDSALLHSRELILQKMGFQVTSALGFDAAIRHCGKTHFDLFLLGHSIPTADKRILIEKFQQNCPAPIVEMHLPDQLATGSAQYEFDSSRSPKELAELIRDITGTESSSRLRAKQKRAP